MRAPRVALLAVVVAVLSACGHSGPTDARPPQDTTRTVSVQFASEMPMLVAVGDTLDLRGLARYYSGAVASDSVTWSSADAAVLSVVGGVGLAALKPGFSTIVAAHGSASASAKVWAVPVSQLIAVGQYRTCVIDRMGELYCWGLFLSSQTTVPTAARLPFKAIAVTAASSNTCVLDGVGTVYCWGSDRLFTGVPASPNTPFSTPRTVNVPILVSLQLGQDVVCGLTGEGAAYCWGVNNYGQLGVGDTLVHASPVRAAGPLTFSSLSQGLQHACGIAGGDIYCWGFNYFGADGAFGGARPAPQRLTANPPLVRIFAGGLLTCGLDAAGKGYCWGTSTAGELGNGNIRQSTATLPAPIAGGHTFEALAPASGNMAYTNSCGLATDGRAYCWGSNASGGLGVPSAPDYCSVADCSATPLLVSGGLTFRALGVGARFACGLTRDHRVYCWGLNDSGQLGDGSTTNRNTPVPVAVTLSLP